RHELDARAILGGMSLLGERQPGARDGERRVRRVVVQRLDLRAERVAIEGDRAVDVRDGEDDSGARRHQLCVWPPSATSICPVIQPASSEARNAIAGAMSAGTARRGIACSIWTKSNASACLLASTPSVAVKPGATELTVIPCGPSSRASARVNANTPPFEAT